VVKVDCFLRDIATLFVSRSRVLLSALAVAAPIPPLALLDWKLRITGLRHGRTKDIETTYILMLRRGRAQRFIQSFGIPPGELRDAAYPENFEITKHGRADRNQIRKLTRVRSHKNLLASGGLRIYTYLV
jgi:hypothetical protein